MRNEDGFTLLELVIGVAAMAIFGVITTAFFANAMLGWTRSSAEIQLQEDYQAATETFMKDVNSATAIAPSTAYGGSITTGTATFVLLVPARDSNNNFLYLDSARTYLCKNEVAYYLSSGKLWRQTFVNNTSGCDAAAGNAGTATTIALIENTIAGIEFWGGSTVGNCTLYSTLNPDCKSIFFDINLRKTAFGKNYYYYGAVTADILNRQVYSDTFYFQAATPTDPNNAWSTDADAADGSYVSYAANVAAGSASSNYLGIPNTSVPSTLNGRIYDVSARIYGCGTGGNLSAVVYESGTTTLLGTPSITVASCGTPTAGGWTTLSTHSGGWSFSKVATLDTRIFGASASMRAGIVEIRVKYL